ncbi:MAG: aminoglycoside phosphotransferase family protein [Chloroflexi bacterium]|nr:aminoglycoside phosphotransferase family protein [Chloroflexota bacterium]
MLEKPALDDEMLITCLQAEYGLSVIEVTFLPLGADLNTAVYRVSTIDGPQYFLKLRQGTFNETSVTLPKFLYDQGITQIIAPLHTRTGGLWATLEAFKVILYPFVEGRNGYQVNLTDHHWVELGAALKRVHTAALPHELIGRFRRETYSPRWREIVQGFVAHAEDPIRDDPLAINLAAFLRAKREVILDLTGRAERLARALQAERREFVLCHSDVHAGNVLIDSAGALYIVDWDDPILAPKERDLMFPGGAQGFRGHTPEEEETLFYQGYGQTQIDHRALAYYRYERIVEDLAIECEQIFSTTQGGEDREQAFEYFKSNFLPENTIEIAYQSDLIS